MVTSLIVIWKVLINRSSPELVFYFSSCCSLSHPPKSAEWKENAKERDWRDGSEVKYLMLKHEALSSDL